MLDKVTKGITIWLKYSYHFVGLKLLFMYVVRNGCSLCVDLIQIYLPTYSINSRGNCFSIYRIVASSNARY